MKRKRILVAALDWGLGHATRMIPVIRALDTHGFSPVIASAGSALKVLRSEFPDHPVLELPSVRLEYSSGSVAASIVRQSPHLIQVMRSERKLLEEWIDKGYVDGVISDNRYGLYSDRVPCVLVTHQIRIPAPLGSAMVSGLVRRLISRFDACWVPDAPARPLSGRLSESDGVSVPVEYIGALSRFKALDLAPEWDVTVIVSGPEPHRSAFEELMGVQLGSAGGSCLMVLGKPGAGIQMESEAIALDERGFSTAHHLSSHELNTVVAASKIVVSRSGYSTLMDLSKTGSRAIFVPTPTQPEQEYLAERMNELGVAPAHIQGRFDLEEALVGAADFAGFSTLGPGVQPRWGDLFAMFD